MRILILGGTGFIGSHIVDALILEGHSITVIDRTLKHTQQHQNINYIQADFSDKNILSMALKGMDLVIHLISTTGPKSSNEDPIFDTQSNLINTIQLLEIMRQEHVQRLIYFSSGGTVYGNPLTVPILESVSTQPLCSYGITKVAIENHIHMHQELYGLKATILRPSNPYGPRQAHIGTQGVIATFVNRMLHKEAITIWGDGSVIRDYIYISDIVSASLAAVKQNITGIFNIGSGRGYTVHEIVTQIESILDTKAIIKHQPKRNFDIPSIILETTAAHKQLHWKPMIELNEGIRKYYHWFAQ